jgi:pimeloyl-ACP methyl ester carboxylesterase
VERLGGDLLLEHVPPAGPARGLPMLMVHGMHGGSWYLRNYLDAAAADGWDAWAVNLRGHRGSRPVADLGAVSVLDYVEDVRDCLRALGPAVVLGHSMGGLVAQKVAELEPERCRAAVFLTSAPPRGIAVLRWPVISRLVGYLPALVGRRPFVIRPEDAAALLGNRLDPETQARAYEELAPESGRAALELALGRIAVEAGRVRCPTLVMGAELDQITPVEVQRRIASRYGSYYLEVAGHAHMLMLEPGWERPFAEVRAWLDRSVPAAVSV